MHKEEVMSGFLYVDFHVNLAILPKSSLFLTNEQGQIIKSLCHFEFEKMKDLGLFQQLKI